MDPVKRRAPAARKPRIATAWLGGCSGCHMSFLDLDERLIDLAPLVDLVYSPIMDVKEFPEDVDVTLVEGAVANEENLHQLKLIRERDEAPRLVRRLRGHRQRDRHAQPAAPGRGGPEARLHRERGPRTRGGPPTPASSRRCSTACGPCTRWCRWTSSSRAARPRPTSSTSCSPSSWPAASPDLTGPPQVRLEGTHAMGQRIVIDPVTRIEGHAKITLLLDDQGEVSDAQFHVVEFRGFEKFCEGRSFREMPGITSRICGICPVSHMLASAKAGDELLAVEIPRGRDPAAPPHPPRPDPPVARALLLPPLLARLPARPRLRPREAQHHRPHRGEPRRRARAGIRLRQFGQEIIETLAGKKIHSTWVVPGRRRRAAHRRRPRPDPGVAARGEGDDRQDARPFWKREMDRHQDEARVFGNFPSLFMGLVDARRRPRALRRASSASSTRRGTIVADQLRPAAVPRVHRRGGRALDLPEVPLLQAARLPRRDVPRRARSPGSTSPRTAGRRSPTASSPSSGSSAAARCSPPSTTTTPGSSRSSTASSGSRSSSPTPTS